MFEFSTLIDKAADLIGGNAQLADSLDAGQMMEQFDATQMLEQAGFDPADFSNLSAADLETLASQVGLDGETLSGGGQIEDILSRLGGGK
ncbi:MAG: hypothetical protein ACPGRZ_07485 [Alphaproteobacteria bacterium]